MLVSFGLKSKFSEITNIRFHKNNIHVPLSKILVTFQLPCVLAYHEQPHNMNCRVPVLQGSLESPSLFIDS